MTFRSIQNSRAASRAARFSMTALVLLLLARPAHPATFNQNLVINGDGSMLTGWQGNVSSMFTSYDPTSEGVIPSPSGGNVFDFYPNNKAASDTLVQLVAIDDVSSQIDSGTVRAVLVGEFLRCFQGSVATMRLDALGASDILLKSDSVSTTGTENRWITDTVALSPIPPQTRKLRIVLRAVVGPDPLGSLWGYDEFDNIRLYLRSIPLVETGAASAISGTAATVSGAVLPTDGPASPRFEYGTSTSYGSIGQATPGTVIGSAKTAVTASLSNLVPNSTYHYRAAASSFSGTGYGADATFVTPAIPAAATTAGASAISGSGATVKGIVNANNATTTSSIEYGLTTAYGSAVATAPSSLTDTITREVSAAIGGLAPNTTYHYRVTAVNSAGTTYGRDSSFTTSAVLATAATGVATEINSTSASIAGSINANNATTTDSVQFGTTTAYGTTVVASPATASGTEATSVSTRLTGLNPATTYHYRLKATNSAGASYGLDATFTTLDAQTITFASPASQVYGTSFLKLGATASSGLAITYASANPAVARISNDTAYLLAADTVTITASQAGNASYDAAASVSQKLTITKKPLSITGAAASNKVYDGTVSASVTGAFLDAPVSGDDVSLVLGAASFASKNVGTAKTVTVSGSSLSGTDAGNYSLTEVSGLSANITSKPITVTADAKSKVYGSSDPSLTYVGSTLVSGDSYTGSLSRASGDTVGSYAIGQGTLTAGGNYALTFTGANLSITKKPLSITAAAASNKVYDGTVSVSVTGASLDAPVSGDDVSLVLGAASFATKDTGTAKTVTVSGSSLSGTDAGNYSLTEVSGLSANITSKPITVTADAKSKVYGSSDPSLTYVGSTLVSGDSYTGSLSRASGDTVGSYAIGQGTLTAGGNYALIFTGANLSITPAPLTITAKDETIVFGRPDPSFGVTITGLVNGDSAEVVSGLQVAREAGSAVGEYDIVPSGASAPNYQITYVNGTLTIEASTGIASRRTLPKSHVLESRALRGFARPALGRGDGDLALASRDLDCVDGSCLSVDVLLPQAGELSVVVYDNLGLPVIRWHQSLAVSDLWSLERTDDDRRVARIVWNLRSETGEPVPEGVYLWRIEARLQDGTKLEDVRRLGVKRER